MTSTQAGCGHRYSPHNIRSSVFGLPSLVWLGLFILSCGVSAGAQSQKPAMVQAGGGQASSAQAPGNRAAGQQAPGQQLTGSISGAVVDTSGAALVGAMVTLTREDQTPKQQTVSGDDGQFSFANLAPGIFHITVTATSFATQTFTGALHPGEIYTAPSIVLALAAAVSEVQVIAPRSEVAEAQIKAEEKQRVLGFVPNFYVTYASTDTVPLTSKQKFALAWKATIDPVTFVITGGIAGIQQAQNHFRSYGQGAEGYAKRFGASYTGTVTGTFIGSAMLPSLLKQDPRYFYKGTGSIRSRFLYAIANSVITKGDNKRWQPNYSGIMGSLAASGISNLYYPAQDRDGAELTFENALIGIGTSAGANLFQEFLVRKLTPNLPHRDPAKT